MKGLKIILLIIPYFSLGCVSTALVHGPMSMLKARVVIDAGHGGVDTGAVGEKGLKEKDVTLDIALRLQQLFKHYLPRVQVILTRKSDRFFSLEERLKLANKVDADIFLSIHVNSSEEKNAQGFEIFSLDVASDRHSERLAARENKSGKDEKATFILADLWANSNRKESDRLAKFVSRGLEAKLKKSLQGKEINNRGYNQAIFHILFVNSPAILTELFFISNPKEEEMLRSPKTRQMLAKGILSGIYGFLSDQVMRAEHESKR